MTRYATTTTVPIERTRTEIEQTLKRYGATAFAYAWDDNVKASIMRFRMHDRMIAIRIPQPSGGDPEIKLDARGKLRTEAQREKVLSQAERTRWRAVLLVVKSKCESVESGIETFEQTWLAHIEVPGQDGVTVGDQVIPMIEEGYRKGEMPQLVHGLGARALPAGGYGA